jgi:hypothetical protein
MTKNKGIYHNFYENYFDPKTNEFTFDTDTADIRCMLCNIKYKPDPEADKTWEDIARYEIKKHTVPHWITTLEPEKILEIGCTYHTKEPLFKETSYKSPKAKKVMVPNGYDSGGLSVGPVRSVTREVLKATKHGAKPYYQTNIYTEALSAVWGEQLDENGVPKYPERTTLTVGTIVYYLNNGKKNNSPLISYFKGPDGGWSTVNGLFTVTHGLDGIFYLSVDKDLNAHLEAHPDWEVVWHAGG